MTPHMTQSPSYEARRGLKDRLLSTLAAELFCFSFFPLVVRHLYGIINSQIFLAIIPAGIILLLIIAYSLCAGRSHINIGRILPLDLLVTLYFLSSVIQLINPLLPHLGYSLRGFYESSFWMFLYFMSRLLVSSEKDLNFIVKTVIYVAVVTVIYSLFMIVVSPDEVLPDAFMDELNANKLLMMNKRAGGVSGAPFTFSWMSAIGLGLVWFSKINSSKRLL